MKTTSQLLGLTALGLILVAGQPLSAQTIVLTGSEYNQDFNDIDNGLPDGWTVRTGATTTSPGNVVPFTTTRTNWAATSGQFANFASYKSDYGTNFLGTESTTIQNETANRAPGVRQTSGFGDPGAAFVMRIQDTVGLSDFQLSLDLIMLNVQPRSTVWTIDYAVGNSPSAFIPVGTYSDPGVFGATNRTFSFGGALDNQPENVWIRIAALSSSTGSGNRDTFGIDNVRLTYGSATVTNPVSITSQPQSRTNNAGTLATFTVGVTGTGPIYYQWYKDNLGNPLSNAGNISGADTPTLNVATVTSADAGGYFVIVSNILNAVTSQVATLTVLDPIITSPPLSRTNLPGDNANFFVGASGTTPLSYQWYFNGAPIPDATANTLNLTNALASHAGNYFVVVTNGLGAAVTSSVATLTILNPPTTRLVRWDFNSPVPDANTSTGTNAPSEGNGTALLLSTNTAAFAGGTFSDPAYVLTGDNSGWNITTYPAVNAGNKTGGVEYRVSTVGYQDIFLYWEQRHSATASRYHRLQYTTDGVNFVDHDVIAMDPDRATTFVTYMSDLSGIPAVNNNPNFAFRIVAEFESTATGSGTNAYVGTSATYGTSGTVRFDLVSVYGNAATQPSAIPLYIERSAEGVTLSWNNPAFKLQAAPTVTGTFTNVPGASSPWPVPASAAQQYFRLIWP